MATMSRNVVLGEYADGTKFEVSIDRLVEIRLIVQASSGGFNNAISGLNTLGPISRNHEGKIKLNEDVIGI